MSSTDDDSSLVLHAVYVEALREHAAALIWMGHERLRLESFSASEEDDITGELVRLIKEEVCCDPDAPEWVDHYEVHEQTRQNIDGRRGKRRPIMDIEVERHHRGPRPKLGFEAKRLGHSHTVKKYLSKDGMMAFLNNYYPTTHDEGGMIGYVQQNTVEHWAMAISAEALSNKSNYRVIADSSWEPHGEPANFFVMRHTCEHGRPFNIVHIFLPFC